jgi:hypothetical protein
MCYAKVYCVGIILLTLTACKMTADERAVKLEKVRNQYSHISNLGLCLRHLEGGGYWMGEEIERREVDCYTFDKYLSYKKHRQERRRKLQNDLMSYGKSSNVQVIVK